MAVGLLTKQNAIVSKRLRGCRSKRARERAELAQEESEQGRLNALALAQANKNEAVPGEQQQRLRCSSWWRFLWAIRSRVAVDGDNNSRRSRAKECCLH